MATIKCPTCGYSESDGRPHDSEVYEEMCVQCTRRMCNGVRELLIADAFTPPDLFGHSVKT